jgi:hypothetical protein
MFAPAFHAQTRAPGAHPFKVAIDCGDLTGFGPREVDVAWFALKGAARIGCPPDAIFANHEAAADRPLEPEALDLACIGSLAQMEFLFAASAFASGPDSQVAKAQLTWWTERASAEADEPGLRYRVSAGVRTWRVTTRRTSQALFAFAALAGGSLPVPVPAR